MPSPMPWGVDEALFQYNGKAPRKLEASILQCSFFIIGELINDAILISVVLPGIGCCGIQHSQGQKKEEEYISHLRAKVSSLEQLSLNLNVNNFCHGTCPLVIEKGSCEEINVRHSTQNACKNVAQGAILESNQRTFEVD
jgi:hypothetical protein